MTADGGQTWSEPRTLPAPTDLGLEMLDAQHGYIAWATTDAATHTLTVYRTDDGGRTWRFSTAGTVAAGPGEDLMEGVHFVDRLHGVVLGTALNLSSTNASVGTAECAGFATDDGGATWAKLAGAPCQTDVTWATALLGLVVPIAGGGDVSISLDGGRSWQRGTLPGVAASEAVAGGVVTLTPAGAVRFATRVRPLNGGVSGPQPLTVFESIDRGATWREAYRSTSVDATALASIQALDADHWLATMASGPSLEGMDLSETWDAGRTWTFVSHAAVQPGPLGSWADRLHGVIQGVPISCLGTACGGSGTMLLTNDGGLTWHQVPF